MKNYTENEKSFLVKLGRNIRNARISKGHTQQDVSAFCGMEESRLSRIENGKTNSTIGTIKRIVNVLKIAISEVFSGV